MGEKEGVLQGDLRGGSDLGDHLGSCSKNLLWMGEQDKCLLPRYV